MVESGTLLGSLPVAPDSPMASASTGGYGRVLRIGGAVFGAVMGMATGLAGSLAPGAVRPLLLTSGLILAATGGFVAITGPWLAARFRRWRAAGSVPALVAFAILYLRLTPTLEGAADLASRAVGGPLGASMERHRLATPTGQEAFQEFAAEWADADPSLERAVSLLGAAVDAPPEDRAEILESALDAVLDSSRDRVATFASDIRGPATGIYAFGVMLPLALVGMMPVLSTTGGGIPVGVLAVGYDVLLPAGLLVASAWLASKRPAVSAPPVSRSVFSHAPGLLEILAAGGLAAASTLVAATLFLPAWSHWIATTGVGAGVCLRVALGPVRDRQEQVRAVEEGIPDALQIAGRALADGAPVEATVGRVGDRLAGPIGTVFERAATVRRRLGTPVHEAFTGRSGALDDMASRRAEMAVELLTTAGAHGAPAGPTLRSVGEYLEALERVERETRRDLARTTSTLHQTAMLFAPAIAGVTVGLATGIDATGSTGKPVPVAALGTAIGLYVLLLAVILPSLAVVLERGFDPVRIGNRSGLALGVAGVVYPVAFLGAETLVYI